MEYNYSENIVDENLEKICLKFLDISDILAEYIILLMEKFLQKDDDFDGIFEELYEYYSGGFGFLSPFEAYSYLWGGWDFEIDENNKLIDGICEKIPEIIADLRSGKIYNLTFDDVDFQKYGFIAGSVFSPFQRRFTYDEK